MATAPLKICMTFMLLHPMTAAQSSPYSISQQLWPLSWLSRTSHTPRFIPITPACSFSLLCWFRTPLLSQNAAVPRGSVSSHFCFLLALILQRIQPLSSQARGFKHNSYIQWQLPNLHLQFYLLPKARLTDQTTWCPLESLTQTHQGKNSLLLSPYTMEAPCCTGDEGF